MFSFYAFAGLSLITCIHFPVRNLKNMHTEEIEGKRSLTGWVRHLQKGTGSRQVAGEMSLELGLNVNNRQKV